MKIKRLEMKNFAKFTDFECEFDGKVTHLVGINGAGKTTVGLTAIWAGLKGISENDRGGQLLGERFRFIGSAKKSADIEIVVFDEARQQEVTIRNHITKDANKITVSPVQSADWINDLLSVAFLSAKNFTGKTRQEQAILLGIDTGPLDAKITEIKTEGTVLARELKAIGEIGECKEVEVVDFAELVREKTRIEKHNEDQDALSEEIEGRTIAIQEKKEFIAELKAQLKEAIADSKKMQDALDAMPEPELPIPTGEINKRINNAQSTNAAAARYQQWKEDKARRDKAAEALEKCKERLKAARQDRIDYIKTFNFGFDGLTVDEKGGLLLNERPIREPYFSKGELEIIVAKIHAAQNPGLKVRFIDNFEVLDQPNQEKIIKELLDKGFQVITAEIGQSATKANTILLKECKRAETETPEGEGKDKLI
jgi:ABC-type oligopeptide transport system ATPase subunit